MSFKHAPRGLKDERLRFVESGKIGSPSRVVGQIDSHHRVGSFEKFVRLFKEQGSFRLHKSRLHKSMPSARTSRIKGVRSS
jgi:hypothetical protein